MSKHVTFRRVVDPGMDGDDFEIEKIGENTYKIRTGASDEFDFRNDMKREAFRQKFADVYNEAAGDDREDRYVLDPNDLRTKERFEKFEKRLEEGADSYELRVRD